MIRFAVNLSFDPPEDFHHELIAKSEIHVEDDGREFLRVFVFAGDRIVAMSGYPTGRRAELRKDI